MRIFFAGTTANAAKVLDALVSGGIEVVGVLTRKDAIQGREKSLRESPVAETSKSLGLEVFKANRIDDSVQSFIRSKKPDLGIVVAYGSIFRSETLGIPHNGWINLHFSLLPLYRGAAPVQRALLEGSSAIGVSCFLLDEGVDSGPILCTEKVDVPSDANAGEVLEKLTSVGIEMLNRVLGNFQYFFDGKITQNELEATFAPKVSREDARINPHISADRVHNQIRAMNPEPVAWFDYLGQSIRVLKGRVSATATEAGLIKLVDKQAMMGCSTGSIVLEIVQPAGKQPMSGADWFRGLRSESISIS